MWDVTLINCRGCHSFNVFQRVSCSSYCENDYPIDCKEVNVLKALFRWLLHDPQTRTDHAEQILKLINYEHISKEDECKLKECTLFTDLQDRCTEAGVWVLNEFVKARSKDQQQHQQQQHLQQSGIVNVRGFEPAIVNVGGFKAFRGVSNDLTYYHASSKTWKYLTTIPHVEQCDYGIAVCNNRLYVVGGCFNQSLQEHIHGYGFCYDPATGDWSAIRPMVHERCRFFLAAVGDRLYAIGGIGEGRELPDGSCECYDIPSNTWYDVAPLPMPVSQHPGAVLQERVYVSGGLDPVDESPLDQLSCYDPASGVWDDKEPMLSPRCDHSMIGFKNKLFVAGGWYTDTVTSNREILSTMDCFDLETHQWAHVTHMPTPRYHASMALLGGEHIYLIGGFTAAEQFGRGATRKMDVYNVETESWVAAASDYPYAVWENLACVMYVPTCLESRPIEAT